MQNRYVGDVGDFANNGLLRWLCGMTSCDDLRRLSLGVVSYLNHDVDEGGNLTPDRYQELGNCDIPLYETMQHLVDNGLRNVHEFDEQGMLPGNTLNYHECRCNFTTRQEWLNGALEMVNDSEIVFMNPDIGIAEEDYAPAPDSPKHTYLSDLTPFTRKGKSLIIYQHTTRGHGRGWEQARYYSARLTANLGLPVRALRFRRLQARFYLIVLQPQHDEIVSHRLQCLAEDNCWSRGNPPTFEYCPHPNVQARA